MYLPYFKVRVMVWSEKSSGDWVGDEGRKKPSKNFMVLRKISLQVMIYRKIINLIINRNKIKRKFVDKLFYSIEFSKNVLPKISGWPLIGQNDSLDVLILEDFKILFKIGLKCTDQYFLG